MCLHLLLKEIVYRPWTILISVTTVAIAVGMPFCTMSILTVHDAHTAALLAEKETETKASMSVLNDEMRKATLKLGFNLLILPKQANRKEWHAKDYADAYMPEAYVTQLADSGIITVRHFLPSLQRKIKWPETKRTIILIGTRGEVPNLHKDPRNPMVQLVPAGTMVLGYELHQSLALKVGDRVSLLGKMFTVNKCHGQRGSKDDISVWISLHEAQELFGKEGQINAILALKCLCMGSEDIARLREKIAAILPNTQCMEIGTRVVARAEARVKLKKQTKKLIEKEKQERHNLRMERQQMSSLVVPLIIIACIIWLAYQGFTDVRNRKLEIGILQALGYRPSRILVLFLGKSLASGLIGGVLGSRAGDVLGRHLGVLLEGGAATGVPILPGGMPFTLWAAGIIMACLLSVVAGWVPALSASLQDPAQVLQHD